MSVAHPATTPPLISKLNQKLDLDAPPDYGLLLDQANTARRDLDIHIATYRDAIKAVWYYDLTRINGNYAPYDYDEGFRRLAAAFPEIEEMQTVYADYENLSSRLKLLQAAVTNAQEADRKYRILVETTDALTHALNGYEEDDQ